MGKRRKTKKFDYDANRRRKWRKLKKPPTIECDVIKANWDKKKGIKENLAQMGLTFNPNTATSNTSLQSIPKSKTHVVEELEQLARTEVLPKQTMPLPEIQFCEYMIKKHKDDYVAMARDLKNYFQDTPKQIRRKIMKYHNFMQQKKT